MKDTLIGRRRMKENTMKGTYGIAAVLAIVAATALPGGVAKAATPIISSNADIFDSRADSAAVSYCIDAPAVLIGQKICGGVLRSTVTATSDPRGFALGGLAPAPKLSSVPLLIPNNVQGIPIPQQVQDSLKIRTNNIPSQCQAAFPELNPGDSDQTCGGPTIGDTELGVIASGSNARVTSTGDAQNPTQTRTIADSRAASVNLTGLQSTYDNVRSVSESGLNTNGDPTGRARMNAARVVVLGGVLVIDDIVSATTIAFNGTKEGTAVNTSFSYAGATVAGIPVEITPDGLVLATEKVPADQVKALTTQLNTVLANNNGFGVKLLPAPPIEVTPSLVRATSGGIEVTYSGSTGTDVTYTQIIGTTFAQVSAVPTGDAGDFAVTPSTDASSGTSDTSAGSHLSTDTTGVEAATGVAGLLPSFGVGATPVDSAVGVFDPSLDPATSTGVVTQSLRAVGDQALLAGFPIPAQALDSSRVQDMYPVFCLLLLLALVAARFRRIPFSKQAG